MEKIRAGGDRPAFLGYTPRGAERPFPAALCVSINDEIVHGIPNEREKIFREGDMVGYDLGLVHRGMYSDMAISVGVGEMDGSAERLIEATRAALISGISAARAGARVGDIGYAIEESVRGSGFSLVEELGGHGVGRSLHEEPFISNIGKRGAGVELKSGMVFAIEPMINEGSGHIILDDDGYTYRTKDGKRSAHFEHTILVREGEPEILTNSD